MGITFPDAWSGLSRPHERFELEDKLDELAQPERTALWTSQGTEVQGGGIDETLRFFFDGRALDRSAIGASLFDDREAVAVRMVTNALDAVFKTNRRGDSRYFLRHRGWKQVQSTAQSAHRLMIANDVARSG